MNGMHAFQRAPRAWKSPHHSKTGICAPPRGDFRPVAASKFGNNYTETKTKPQKPAASGLCHEVAPKFSEHKNGWLGRECGSYPSPVRTSANREKNRKFCGFKAVCGRRSSEIPVVQRQIIEHQMRSNRAQIVAEQSTLKTVNAAMPTPSPLHQPPISANIRLKSGR